MEANNNKSGPEKISDLITQLANNDGSVREKARLILIDIGEEAVPSLIEALASKQQQVRWEAAKALVSIADPIAIPTLIKALQDEIFDIRWLAAEALIAIGTESIEPLLRAVVDQTNESYLREGAHHVIAYIIRNDSKASELNEILKPVKKALDSTAPRVVAPGAALVALEKLKQFRNKQSNGETP
jgi:HEAT repeat protein